LYEDMKLLAASVLAAVSVNAGVRQRAKGFVEDVVDGIQDGIHAIGIGGKLPHKACTLARFNFPEGSTGECFVNGNAVSFLERGRSCEIEEEEGYECEETEIRCQDGRLIHEDFECDEIPNFLEKAFDLDYASEDPVPLITVALSALVGLIGFITIVVSIVNQKNKVSLSTRGNWRDWSREDKLNRDIVSDTDPDTDSSSSDTDEKDLKTKKEVRAFREKLEAQNDKLKRKNTMLSNKLDKERREKNKEKEKKNNLKKQLAAKKSGCCKCSSGKSPRYKNTQPKPTKSAYRTSSTYSSSY